MNVYEYLISEYDKRAGAVKELQAKIILMERSIETIPAEIEKLNALLRATERALDEALLQDNTNRIADLKIEKTQIDTSVKALEHDLKALPEEIRNARAEALKEREKAAKQTISECYGDVRKMTFDSIEATLDCISKAHSDLKVFEASTGPCLTYHHRERLVPTEGPLFNRIQYWLG